MKDKFLDVTNEGHDPNKSHSDIYMIESFIVKNEEMAVSLEKLGLEKLPVGSWVGAFKVDNKEVFEKVLSGELRGFSVEAWLDSEIKLADVTTEEKLSISLKSLLFPDGIVKDGSYTVTVSISISDGKINYGYKENRSSELFKEENDLLKLKILSL
jgi:hypothetical protein